jgi:hypothetical protein
VRLRDGDAEQAEVGHGPKQLGGERFQFIPSSRTGRDLLLDESGHHVLEHLLFFRQPGIDTEPLS